MTQPVAHLSDTFNLNDVLLFKVERLEISKRRTKEDENANEYVWHLLKG